MARDIATLRMVVHQTWTVDETGSGVNLEAQTNPVYTDVENGVSFGDWAEAAEYAGVQVPEGSSEPPAPDPIGASAQETSSTPAP